MNWINVKERTPELGIPVLCLVIKRGKNDPMFVGRLKSNKDGVLIWKAPGSYRLYSENDWVTHWSDLPEIPDAMD